MNDKKELWYITYLNVGDPIGLHNIGLLDKHPIDYVIEKNNKVIIIYSIKITEDQGRKLAEIIKGFNND